MTPPTTDATTENDTPPRGDVPPRDRPDATRRDVQRTCDRPTPRATRRAVGGCPPLFFFVGRSRPIVSDDASVQRARDRAHATSLRPTATDKTWMIQKKETPHKATVLVDHTQDSHIPIYITNKNTSIGIGPRHPSIHPPSSSASSSASSSSHPGRRDLPPCLRLRRNRDARSRCVCDDDDAATTRRMREKNISGYVRVVRARDVSRATPTRRIDRIIHYPSTRTGNPARGVARDG